MGKTYKLDPARRVLSGLSGGGREAAEGGIVHPEFMRQAMVFVLGEPAKL